VEDEERDALRVEGLAGDLTIACGDTACSAMRLR